MQYLITQAVFNYDKIWKNNELLKPLSQKSQIDFIFLCVQFQLAHLMISQQAHTKWLDRHTTKLQQTKDE